jgi:hypothetical protein
VCLLETMGALIAYPKASDLCLIGAKTALFVRYNLFFMIVVVSKCLSE